MWRKVVLKDNKSVVSSADWMAGLRENKMEKLRANSTVVRLGA